MFFCSTDINECLGDHNCNHTCSNTDGSYSCMCDRGYNLQADGRSCTGIIYVRNSCNMDISGLPDMYTRDQRPRARVLRMYISGRPQVPLLQICNTSLAS